MREQIAHGELACGILIVQLKLGEVIDDAIVPLEFSFIDEHRERGNGHRFRRRPDREARVLGRGRGLPQLEHTVALREHQRIVLHDRDREPRHAPVACRVRDVFVEGDEVG